MYPLRRLFSCCRPDLTITDIWHSAWIVEIGQSKASGCGAKWTLSEHNMGRCFCKVMWTRVGGENKQDTECIVIKSPLTGETCWWNNYIILTSPPTPSPFLPVGVLPDAGEPALGSLHEKRHHPEMPPSSKSAAGLQPWVRFRASTYMCTISAVAWSNSLLWHSY